MKAEDIQKLANHFINTSQANIVPKEKALQPQIAGMRIYDEPVIGYASPRDSYFETLKKTPEAMLGGLMLPLEWQATAGTVISFFLPFTQCVRESNRADMSWPYGTWLNARIE